MNLNRREIKLHRHKKLKEINEHDVIQNNKNYGSNTFCNSKNYSYSLYIV